MNAVNKISVEVSAVLGQATLPIRQLLKMGRGAVIDLNTLHDDPVTIQANGEIVAMGEIVIVGEKIGVTITEVIGADPLD